MKRRKGKEREREQGEKERAKCGTLVGLKDLTADWDLVPYLDISLWVFISCSSQYTHCYLFYSGFPIRPLPQFWITLEQCLRTCSERAFFHRPSASNCLAWCTHCSQ